MDCRALKCDINNPCGKILQNDVTLASTFNISEILKTLMCGTDGWFISIGDI